MGKLLIYSQAQVSRLKKRFEKDENADEQSFLY